MLSCRGEALFSFGEETDIAFTASSMVVDELCYTVYADKAMLSVPLTASVLWPVLLISLLGFVFLGVTYLFSKRYYRPIDNIGQMVEHHSSGDEIDDILEGVRSLIGERNGYRERMITITPYAKQGILHSLISGDVKHQQLEVLTNEQFIGLRKAYFMLAVVNIAAGECTSQQYRDALELIAHACRELSSEEHTVVCCEKNVQNLFVIINSDDSEGMEALFYPLYQACVEALDDPRFAVTIGVSGLEDDIASLRDACQDAEQALGQMLTGGRSSVYFHEENQSGEPRRYYFPKDAHKRIVRGLKEGNLADLEAMLQDIYRQNAREVELPPSELRLMLDELHVTCRNALCDVFDMSATHIQIQRIREAATLEEIFAYYRTVLATAISQRAELPDEDVERALETEICDYIAAHFCDPELSLGAVADAFGVSTKMVGLVCKQAYGKTFLQHVRDLQIQHAVELLQNTDDTLEEIAGQCGFANLLTFRRNFKAVVGMNPSDYRK
ncbi:MAG: AraC family transcriptional regulator [Clostridiales bacterium]|nr:AraC family transcriptional regulator [Clostridiales bacterium]